MKVLKILNGNDDGGVFTCEVQYIEELKKRNVKVYGVVIGRGKSFSKYKEILEEFIELPALDTIFSGSPVNIFKEIKKSYYVSRKYFKIIKKDVGAYKVDTIIYRRANYMFLAGMLGKKYNKKVFWHLPNIVSSSISRYFYNLVFAKYNIKPVANSQYTKKTVGQNCKYVVYPGYDPKRVINGTLKYRDKFNIPPNVPVFGVAARISPDKAQDIVVKAFVASNAIRNGGYLLLAGGNQDEEFLKKVKGIAGPYWDDRVKYLNKINDLDNFYASVDIVINGRKNAEPFGITVAESLAAGKPVIAYAEGGPSEMIVPGKTGWLISDPTPDMYKNAINESLDQKQNWIDMGLLAKNDSVRYSVQSNVERFLHIIENDEKE